ncbi:MULTISPECIES: serine/threonine-protein kinase [unclassified Leptolyngbya]|uniref:serine/threonine-protein kinase n=1 Tax=unclassified Leptolyngbya TaxID=2650499 RepID=UPI001688CBB4|nr:MULTISPECIES: serine/threonine-protein kinase [unclassified Leptolyngbya]MBD1912175.1 serine/threonine protein kinase [Leptolyngbya sp. FACHB-8]MBD2155066.1 serine/threonine protein kinase [Leptolyngbya sp. FACHB-16]
MSLCINPNCAQPDHPGNDGSRYCQSCKSDMVLQGHYRVMRLVNNRSGFGRVYEAYERNIPKILKVLKSAHNHNAKAVQLFQQEAYVLSQLNHPGVPRVEGEGYFQFHPADGGEPLHCLVMEKIDGPNLKEWMRQQGGHTISEKQAREWLWQVADVLHLVHQQHYFHRDIKPENLMLRSNGQVVLVDFGAARAVTETYMAQLGATGGMTRISSAGYTPPEQEKGQAVPQSDFYALGWTFIYLLTGKQPTDPEVYDPLMDAAHWREFAPQISPAFGDFIDRLIAPRAVDRPQTTTALLNALGNLPDLTTSLPGLQPLTAVEPSSDITEPLYNPDNSAPLTSLPFVHYAATNGHQDSSASANGHKDSDASALDTKPGSKPLSNKSLVDSGRWMWVGSGILTLMLVTGGVSWWMVQETNRTGTLPFPALFGRLPDSLPVEHIKPQAILTGHAGFVNQTIFTSDMKTLISAGADGQILLWDRQTGQKIQALPEGHSSFINALALSGNGRWLASGGADDAIIIWQMDRKTRTGKVLHTLTGHTSPVNTLAMTPNNVLASGGADNTVRTWDVATGKPLRTFNSHEGIVNAIAISPNGKYLVAVGTAPEAVLWNLDTGQEMKRLNGYDGNLNAVVFSPDGSSVLAAGTERKVYIWDARTGELEDTLEGTTGYINSLSMQGLGNRLLGTDSDGKLYLWDLRNHVLSHIFKGDDGPLDHMTVSSDWRVIATGKGTDKVYLWETPPAAVQ